MEKLTNAIIEILKTGSIPNVVLFSDEDVIPEPPYIVVKPENGVINKTRQFRIIIHHKKGFFDELENYTLVELDSLLTETIEDEDGSRYKLYADTYTDVMQEPEDNTYFMERIYYTPLLIK